MSMFSIDLAAERIVDRRSREYFGEVRRSFANDCYRSSLVMLWTIVVCDLVYKMQTLRDMHGDTTAEALLKNVEAKQVANPANPDWELFLLDEVYKRTNLLEIGEYTQLRGLQQLRHLSAHPVLSGTDLLFQPTKEAARAHIRTALEAVLLRPPLFSKKIVNALVGDIAANKASLITKSTLKTYLDARYFPNMPVAVEMELFRALWKFCFKIRNVDTDAHRSINVTALSILFDRHPATIRTAIDEDRANFSDVGPDAELIATLSKFVSEYPSLYSALNNAAQIVISAEVGRDINLKLKAVFLHADFTALVSAMKGENDTEFDKVTEDNWIDFLNRSDREGLLQEVCDLAIQNYGKSASYDDADLRFGRFIVPILNRIDADRMERLLKEIESNSQTFDRRRAQNDHRTVLAAAQALAIDTTLYPRFLANT